MRGLDAEGTEGVEMISRVPGSDGVLRLDVAGLSSSDLASGVESKPGALRFLRISIPRCALSLFGLMVSMFSIQMRRSSSVSTAPLSHSQAISLRSSCPTTCISRLRASALRPALRAAMPRFSRSSVIIGCLLRTLNSFYHVSMLTVNIFQESVVFWGTFVVEGLELRCFPKFCVCFRPFVSFSACRCLAWNLLSHSNVLNSRPLTVSLPRQRVL